MFVTPVIFVSNPTERHPKNFQAFMRTAYSYGRYRYPISSVSHSFVLIYFIRLYAAFTIFLSLFLTIYLALDRPNLAVSIVVRCEFSTRPAALLHPVSQRVYLTYLAAPRIVRAHLRLKLPLRTFLNHSPLASLVEILCLVLLLLLLSFDEL